MFSTIGASCADLETLLCHHLRYRVRPAARTREVQSECRAESDCTYTAFASSHAM